MRALLLTASALLLAGCPQMPDVPDGWQVEGVSACQDATHGDAAWFGAEVQPLLDLHCTSCHSSQREGMARKGAPTSRNYDGFEAASAIPRRLTWARIIDGTMPPVGRLPNRDELATLLDWLNCSSPVPRVTLQEDLNCSADSTVGWADVEPTFSTSCTSCHSASLSGDDRNDAPEGMDFDNAQQVRDFGDEAYIWGFLYRQEMPDGGPVLDNADAAVIHEWLSCGAPD